MQFRCLLFMTIPSNSLPDSFRRAAVRDPASRQLEMAPPWPEDDDYIGTCRSCMRAFRGPKFRTLAKICYECHQKQPPANRIVDDGALKELDVKLVDTCQLRMPDAEPQRPPEIVTEQKLMQDSGNGVSFTIWGVPVPKPRQTQSDRWKKRLCVVRYREWADKAREAAPAEVGDPIAVECLFFLPFPKSWRKNLVAAMKGQPHRHRGDVDNLSKSILDALIPQDCVVARLVAEKRWDDGQGPRVEVKLMYP